MASSAETSLSLRAMAAWVPDRALLALPPDNLLNRSAFARALVRRDVRGRRLVAVD